MTLQTGVYRHFKGKTYLILGIAKHSETLEDLVVYIPQYENETAAIWVRPIESFCGSVEIDGKKVPRFQTTN